jgi:hypothetical protein
MAQHGRLFWTVDEVEDLLCAQPGHLQAWARGDLVLGRDDECGFAGFLDARQSIA